MSDKEIVEGEQKALIHKEQWTVPTCPLWSQTARRIKGFILTGEAERRLSSKIALGQKGGRRGR